MRFVESGTRPCLRKNCSQASPNRKRLKRYMWAGRAERDIRKALSTLPVEQFEVLRMSFFMGRAHADIARELELPLGTVKSRLRLAVAHLRATVSRR